MSSHLLHRHKRDAPTGLAATKVQKGKNHRVELTWNAGGQTVDVMLNTATIATVSNSGSYTHNVGKTPSGDYAYRVCNAGTDDCTLIVTVTYPSGCAAGTEPCELRLILFC